MKMSGKLVSVIIPTYNEEEDILKVLEHTASLEYKNKEVIVVDSGSTDNTREIVEKFSKKYRFVRLIKQKKREGVSSARNLGIKESKGQILIILNADVLLLPDFIKKIIKHYENGAGFVLVHARARNNNYVTTRFVNASQEYFYGNNTGIVWTEGFSCLRKAAFDAGLFSAVGKSAGGEDAIFGENLERRGYKKVFDYSINVEHYVQKDLKKFLTERENNRGRTNVFFKFYTKKIPTWKILSESVLRAFANIMYIVTIVLPVYTAIKMSKFSPRRYKDIPPFFKILILEEFHKIRAKFNAIRVILTNHGQ